MITAGIDIGTTTISAVVYDDEEEKVLMSLTIPNGCFIRTKYEWEKIQDAERIVDKAMTLLGKLKEQYPAISAIGLTGQMHGIIYTDGDGFGVSPLYTWQDGRGSLKEFGGYSIIQIAEKKTNVHAAAGYGLITHLYLANKKLVPETAVSFCTIADYFGMRLCGRKRPLLHISNAESLGFFDLEEYRFQTEALQSMEVNIDILPEVTADFAILGSWNGTPVTVAIGDNQAGFLGSAGFSEGTVLINLGTGGQISVFSESYFQIEKIETRSVTRGKYLLVGSSLCGGKAYAILEAFFRRYMKVATGVEEEQYEVMEKLARAGRKYSGGIFVETTFNGTRDCPDKRGLIGNLDENNFTPEAFAYGVLEGMVRELYDFFEIIQRRTGISIKRFIASGNGLRRNPLLLEMCAVMFKVKPELSVCEEEAACGAAMSCNYKNI